MPTPTTAGRGYQLPHPDNLLNVDVLRIVAAFEAIDIDIVAFLNQAQTLAGVKTFSSSPVVPNVTAGDNSTKAANTAFVQSAIAALVATSPAALDTLNELSAALGNDANFATTITNAIALKAAAVHTHAVADVTGLSAAIAAGNVKLAGDTLQVVNYQRGDAVTGAAAVIPHDDTIPQNTEGVEVLTATITPTSAASMLRIDVVVMGSESTNAGDSYAAALFRDSVADALAVGVQSLVGSMRGPSGLSFTHFVTAGSVAATTFKVRAGLDAAGVFVLNGSLAGLRQFGGVMSSSITITEIKA